MRRKEKNSRFKTRRGKLSVIAGILTLAVAVVIVYIFVKGGGKLDLSVLEDIHIGDGAQPSNLFALDADRSEVIAVLDDGFCTAGKLGVTLLDKAGVELHRDTVPMKKAAVKSAGEYAVVYDIGGRTILVYDTSGMETRITASGEIVDASINEEGWFTVCAQEGGGFKGTCSVYNKEGEKVFYFDSSTGYLISAELTKNSKSVYIMTLTPEGSRILFYNLSSDEEQWSRSLPNEVVFEMKLTQKNGVLAISDKAVTALSHAGEQEKILDFEGRYVGGYSVGNNRTIAVMLLDYAVGTKGRLVTLADDGKILGTIDVDRRLKDILSAGRYIYVLWAGGFEIYDTKLTEVLQEGESASAEAFITRDGKETYLIDGNEAVRIDTGLK